MQENIDSSFHAQTVLLKFVASHSAWHWQGQSQLCLKQMRWRRAAIHSACYWTGESELYLKQISWRQQKSIQLTNVINARDVVVEQKTLLDSITNYATHAFSQTSVEAHTLSYLHFNGMPHVGCFGVWRESGKMKRFQNGVKEKE
jgi:hypothetical protein